MTRGAPGCRKAGPALRSSRRALRMTSGLPGGRGAGHALRTSGRILRITRGAPGRRGAGPALRTSRRTPRMTRGAPRRRGAGPALRFSGSNVWMTRGALGLRLWSKGMGDRARIWATMRMIGATGRALGCPEPKVRAVRHRHASPKKREAFHFWCL